MAKYNVNQTMKSINLTGTKGDELNKNLQMYNLIYHNTFNFLINIVSSLFIWKGLPKIGNEKIRSSFFEMMLATQGSACMADTKEYGLIVSPATVIGLLNIAGNPNKIQLQPAYDVDSYQILGIELDKNKNDKFVWCINDNMQTGFMPLIQEVASELTEVKMALISNASQQKFPIVLYVNRNQKLSMEILTNKVESYDHYVVISSDANMNEDTATGVFGRDLPFVCDKLANTYSDIMNDFFMKIGINSLPYAKKERLLTDEVNANNQAVEIASDVYLQNRKDFAEDCNQMFGLDISVERNTDFIESLGWKKEDGLFNDLNVSRETFDRKE